MDDLAETLHTHAIDTQTLAPLFGDGDETVYGLTVHGSQAVALWQKLRALVDETGRWPVILGDAFSVSLIQSGHGLQVDRSLLVVGGRLPLENALTKLANVFNGLGRQPKIAVQSLPLPEKPMSVTLPTADAILQASHDLDIVAWLTERREEIIHQYTPFDQKGYDDTFIGEWEHVEADYNEYTIPFDLLTKKPLPKVTVAFFPTVSCWQVPAFFKVYGWNDCPVAEVHVGLMKRWFDMYGAEVVGMTHDTIEMCVAHPPITRDDALALTWEQFTYCPDVVLQGFRTLKALASTLINRSVWFFWWD